MNQVSVGGRHIQYILENVLGQTILREDKGHPLKQDDKKEYKLSGGIISTNGSPYIEIRFYSTYTLTITDNLFTFPIVTRTGERHIMKVLTDEQQEAILIYCGFKDPMVSVVNDEDDEEDEPECCGKHCSETKGLKKAMCFNRWYDNETDIVTEQLVCEKCLEDLTTSQCNGCSETFYYTELQLKSGGAFGGGDFFCKSCVIRINSIDYNPDEYV